MTAPRVTQRPGLVRILPPVDFSLDELIERVDALVEAQAARELILDRVSRRAGSGADLTEWDNAIEKRRDDIHDLITWEVSPTAAIAHATKVKAAALEAKGSDACTRCNTSRSSSERAS